MARDPLRLYAFAIREGDLRLAELIHRRLLRRAFSIRLRRVFIQAVEEAGAR